MTRRLPIGAEVLADGTTHFRLWAPMRKTVSVVLESDATSGETTSGNRKPPETALNADERGYFSGRVPIARAGTLYRYRVDNGGDLLPDPASRFQPRGPHGPSQVIDPNTFEWDDGAWQGVAIGGQVLYELHIGTFTQAGTWPAATAQLPALAELGITVIEIMPVAEFAGRFGWGYDGVDLYAPSHRYGTPDEFRQFVARAHALGVAVILDVVYNHLGPDGNYLAQFSSSYFTKRYANEWGDALNFDDDAGPVREFMIANAGYWIDEFHLDGLRFDATHQLFDASAEHLLAEICLHTRAVAHGRPIILVAENEAQDARLVRPRDCGGYGLDGMWNEDFHHSVMVALTGRREAYYTDYLGTPQELVSLAKHGFLYQGQRYSWQDAGRGTPAYGLDPSQFVTFLQNHDQIANGPSERGERVHQLASPGAYRALTAFWLLSPGTPMFFQGQEFAASSPFLYFADHTGALGAAVRSGRAEFMRQFRSAAGRDLLATLPDPGDVTTFERCRLRDDERMRHQQFVALHRDLLSLRRTNEAFHWERAKWVDGAVLGDRAFLLRFFVADPRAPRQTRGFDDDRLVIVNLGDDLELESAPEPLLAPPAGAKWQVRWSSELSAYGGGGTAALYSDGVLRFQGQTTLVLAAEPAGSDTSTFCW